MIVGLLLATIPAIFSAGCFTNKNKDVVEGPPPPPAAYPESSTGTYAATESAPSSINPVYGSAPAPAAPAAPAPFQLREGEQLVTHTIESGETLSSIATKYSTSIGRIQSANGMTGTLIFAGKTLQVPTTAMVPGLAMNAAQPPAAGANAPAPGQTAPYANPGGIAPPAPPAPSYPAATSYPPVQGGATGVQGSGSFPTPSFQGSGIQFSN